jgi:hypothetical protein
MLASQLAISSDLRRRQALALVAEAFGAIDPTSVANTLDADCPDVPQAIATLRQTRPEWFGVEPRS